MENQEFYANSHGDSWHYVNMARAVLPNINWESVVPPVSEQGHNQNPTGQNEAASEQDTARNATSTRPTMHTSTAGTSVTGADQGCL